MSYTSINNQQQEDNKNAPTSADRTAAIASDDPARQNLEEAFQNASTDDSGDSITTTNPHATPNSNDDNDSNKENNTGCPSLSHSSASSIDSEKSRQTEETTDDTIDQQLAIANNTIKLLQAQLVRQRATHDHHVKKLIAQHDLELQSIGCLQINTCRINTDTQLCEQELLTLQKRFSTKFGPVLLDSEATNSLLSRFHKIQANLADLRGGVPTLNLLAEKHNLSLIRLRQDTEIHIAQALRTFETFSNVWQEITKQHGDTLTNYIPGLVKQQRLLIDNIRHLTQLLKDVPGNGSTVLAYMPCNSLDTLEINTDNLTKRFLAYDSELAEQRFKLNRAAQELMQIQLSTKSALTSFEEYFPKQHTTHPIAVCTNTYQTGFVKETPKSNDGNTITRSTSLPPTLYNFQISTVIKKPPKLIK
eukprot:gene13611-15028_t